MAGLYFMGEFMKEKDIEVLSELEDENFYGGLDYSINKGKIDTLDSLLKEEWSNQVFRNAIANNLLANVIEKAPTSAFVKYVMDLYVSEFSYVDQQGKKYRFVLSLEKKNE